MEGKQAFGMALLLLGLLLFIAAILGRAGATFAAMVYGDGVLKPSAPGTAPAKVPGSIVPGAIPGFKTPLIPVPKKFQQGAMKP